MKNTRKYFSLALTLLMLLCLAACGDDGGEDWVTPESFEGLVKDPQLMSDYSMYYGIWSDDSGRELEIELSGSGDEVRYMLSSADGEDIEASGFIQTVSEYRADYFYNERDAVAYHCWFDEDGSLHISSFGAFTLDTRPADLIPADTSALSGTWYLDGDESAESFIEIGPDGNWSLHEYSADGELYIVDSGIIAATDDATIFSAVSTELEDASYDVIVADDGIIYWGGENDCYMKAE